MAVSKEEMIALKNLWVLYPELLDEMKGMFQYLAAEHRSDEEVLAVFNQWYYGNEEKWKKFFTKDEILLDGRDLTNLDTL